MRLRVFLAVAVTLGCALTGSALIARSSPAASVPSDVRAIFNKPAYRNATWGLRVEDGAKVLVDLNPGRAFFIGSVRKVFSVGELLNRVSAAHTYDTPVYRTGSVVGGALRGNLILVASGDLTMGGRTNPDGSIAVSSWDHNEADSLGNAVLTKPDPLAGYRRLARAVKAAGIRRVTGEIVVDDRLFKPFYFRGQFNVKPIFVNDDVVDLSIVPRRTAGSPGDVAWRPQSAALAVRNRLRTGGPNTSNALKVDPILPACIGSPNCSSTIAGSLPSNFVPPLTGRPTLVRTVRVVQPSNYARTVFVEALKAAGVTVDAPAVEPNPARLLPVKGAYRPAVKVAQLTGLAYGQDAKLILKISYNIGADTSLVLFGLTHGVDSMTGALGVEQRTLAMDYGIAARQYHFVDGSGGGNSTATNRAVTHMLNGLWEAPQHAAFFNALPILGVDGSLGFVKDFQRDPSLAGATGKVRAKTGTYVAGSPSQMLLKGQSFAGYITTKSGKHLTFELVVNNVPLTSIDAITKIFQDEGTIVAMLWRDY